MNRSAIPIRTGASSSPGTDGRPPFPGDEAGTDRPADAGAGVSPGARAAAAEASGRTARAASPGIRSPELRYRATITRQATVLASIADFHDPSTLEAGLLALCDGIRRRFGAARVVAGLMDDGVMRVTAISQQATIDPRAPATRLLADAMDEACRDGRQMRHAATPDEGDAEPPGHETPGDEPVASGAAHRALLSGRPRTSAVTTPLCRDGRVVGALLLESVEGASVHPLKLELLRQIATVLAPMIDSRRAAARTLRRHVREGLRDGIAELAAPRRLLVKGAAVGAALALLAALLVPIGQRVTAVAELAPLELRAVTVPVTGYVARVAVSAGDRVREGDVLFELDTRELALERDRQAGELAALSAERRAARASGDRKQAAVLHARGERARAELSLAEQRIARSTVRAPADAIVLAGALEELVGAPVERGQRLVELAPDTGYTVSLLVDERDVGLVEIGQRGTLALEARPGERLAFEIDALHPLAVAGDGRNRFRAEATLIAPPADLLPGQTGVVKVEVGESPALHQLTRRFVGWARLALWERFG